MKIIVGLGNPGKEYKKTRHNVGFMVLDKLAENPWKKNKNGLLLYSWLGGKVEFIKPQTFMNKSGDAVAYIVKKHKSNEDGIIIVHDDIDLPLGTVKISFGDGPAGHNGVSSVINALGSRDFWRVRIGILSRPKEKIETDKFVLGNFSKEELKKIEKITEKILETLKEPIIKAEKFKIE